MILVSLKILVKLNIFLFFMFFLQYFAFGENKRDIFYSAIDAVENSNYEKLIKIIEKNDFILSHVEIDGCSLYCQFLLLSAEDTIDDGMPSVDETAIEILLEYGADPALSPGLIPDLLTEANKFNVSVDELPFNSGVCAKDRDILLLINKLIMSGAYLGDISLDAGARTEDKGKYISFGFYYLYTLCNKYYLCGSDYEQVEYEIQKKLLDSIYSIEVLALKKLDKEGFLGSECLAQLPLEERF